MAGRAVLNLGSDGGWTKCRTVHALLHALQLISARLDSALYMNFGARAVRLNVIV